jgi:hypothetical protein
MLIKFGASDLGVFCDFFKIFPKRKGMGYRKFIANVEHISPTCLKK